MSTETDLPRTIAPSEVRVGDEVEITETGNWGTRSWRFVVAAVTNEFGTGPCIVPPEDLVSHKGWHASVFTMPYPLTLTLLSRPTTRGPAWDAPMGSLWSRGPDVYVRNAVEDSPEQLTAVLLWYVGPITGGQPALWRQGFESVIDELQPFSPPPSELDTLRQNVIDAAVSWWNISGSAARVAAAVRALRDAEAAQ